MTNFERIVIRLLVQIAIEIQRNSLAHPREEYNAIISDANILLRNNND